MSVTLPVLPRPWMVTPRLVGFGEDLTPARGGAAQRSEHLGSRWAIDVAAMPALGPADARRFFGARLKARTGATTLVMTWPQIDPKIAVGAPLVNGASQTGSTLIVDGLAASTAALKAGMFLSVQVSSQWYLYCLTDDPSVNSSGQANLAISPMLRASPADNAAVEVYAPKIEGFLAGPNEEWSVEMLAWVQVPAFTIAERA